MEYLKIFLVAAAVILIVKFLFKLDIKMIIKMIINAALGFLLLYLINRFGLLNFIGVTSIPINWITILLVGVFGFLGLILLVLLSFAGWL